MIEKEKQNGQGHERPRMAVSGEVLLKVKEQALRRITPANRATTNLHFDPFVVEAGAPLGPAFQRWNVDRSSVLVFQDDEPDAGFGHPCSYLLFDSRTGEPRQQIPAEFPPYPLTGLDELRPLYEGVKPQRAREDAAVCAPPQVLAREVRSATEPLEAGAHRRFAILFAGLADRAHLNDLELSYRMLIDTYQFAANDIHVLFHNGAKAGPLFKNGSVKRPWPGSAANSDWRIDVNATGIRPSFQDALRAIAQDMGPNDSLFIHCEGHGGHDRGEPNEKVFLAGYSNVLAGSQYFASDMGDDLNALLPPCRSILILMNQCYAGGFTCVAPRTHAASTYVACAVEADKRARQELSLDWYDFSFDWMQAQIGALVGDAHNPLPGTPPAKNADGSVMAQGAFDYSTQHLARPAVPVFAESPNAGAGAISLRGD